MFGLLMCITFDVNSIIFSRSIFEYPEIIHSVTQWHACSNFFDSIHLKTILSTWVFLKPEKLLSLKCVWSLISFIMYLSSIIFYVLLFYCKITDFMFKI